MGYTSDILIHRVQILNRTTATSSAYGIDGNGIEWENCGCVHADVTWAKGKAAMNAGALDAYAVIMVRMRWNNIINMRSRIIYDDQTYQVVPETFHADKRERTIQLHAQLVIND